MAGTNFLGLSDAESGLVGSGLFKLGAGILQNSAMRALTKAKAAYQQYSNTMVNFGNAASQDAITMNEIMYGVASAEKAKEIQTGGISALGTAETSAAAAGVKGNSVNVTQTHIAGNAANAEFQRARDYKFAMFGFDAQRKSAALSAALQKDNSDYTAGTGAQTWAGILSGGKDIAAILGAF